MIAGGLALLLAAPLHWGAKTMALIVGLVFGAASVIAIFDGHDVFGIFAATGTLLVGIGVFSVMAYTVSQQTREIAVRLALGSTRTNVMGLVLRLGGKLLVLGVAAGVLASIGTNRVIASQLWNTSPHGPLILASAVGLVALVAFAACYIPARRALRIDPIGALRHE